MVLRFFTDRGKKRVLEQWQTELDQARQVFWKNGPAEGKRAFTTVISGLTEAMKGELDEDAIFIKVNAQIGLWAVEYLQDSAKGGAYRKLVRQIEPDLKTWFFISKVFVKHHDTHPEALAAFLALLESRPPEKIALTVMNMLKAKKADLSSETGLALLEQMANVLPENVLAAELLCKVYVKAGDLKKAAQVAHRILQIDSAHQGANRYLGYLAERSENWERAKQYYRLGQDWLRLLAVCGKSRDIPGAAEVLTLVPASQRQHLTCLYYAGWLAREQNEPAETLRYWQELHRLYPAEAKPLSKTLFDLQLHLGSQELFVKRNPQSADPLLRSAVTCQPQMGTAVAYLAVCEVAKQRDKALDRALYQRLNQDYQNGAFYLWLRALWLLSEQPRAAWPYLSTAYLDGVEQGFIPAEAVIVTAWFAAQIASPLNTGPLTDKINSFTIKTAFSQNGHSSPFFQAILPQVALTILKNKSETKEWLSTDSALHLSSPAASRLRSIYFLQQEEWTQALEVLANCPQNEHLRRAIIQTGLGRLYQNQQWPELDQLVGCALKNDPDNPQLLKIAESLVASRHQYLWQSGDFNALEELLQAQFKPLAPNNTRLHHNLALFYTKLATRQDTSPRKLNESEYWPKAIGHWGVVLADEGYWQDWLGQRRQVYDAEMDLTETGDQVRRRAIPDLLRQYHEELAGVKAQVSDLLAKRYRYYGAIVQHEIELSAAIRHAIRAAAKQQVVLPDPVYRLPSPLLLKAYRFEAAAQEIVESLARLRLSPHEAELIRLAFSPLSEIRALAEGGEYQIALSRLRDLIQANGESIEIRQEMALTLESYARQLLEGGKWAEAIEITQEGLKLQPLNQPLEELLTRAAVGWANQQVKEEAYETAVNRMKQIRATLRRPYEELDALLGEALTRRGAELLENKDVDRALKHFKEAILLDPSNLRARSGAAMVYHNWAMAKAEAGKLKQAEKDALQALEYEEDKSTANLLAHIYVNMAIKESEKNNWQAAKNYAHKALEYRPTEQSMEFLVALTVDYSVFLAKRNQYQQAINMLEEAQSLPGASNMADIDSLLSAIYTDYGAYLYNERKNVSGALQAWKAALNYNPDNSTARSNIRLAGGYYY